MRAIGGLIDYGERALASIESFGQRGLGVLASYGYSRLEPPIIEDGDDFIERSGESIRDRMYFFEDPLERALCLRPDYTIPICRMILRSDWSANHWQQGSALRLSYVGPVFRYEASGPGRYRQFTQLGSEVIGAENTVYSDAETAAIASEILKGQGARDLVLRLGDMRFVPRLIETLGLSMRSQAVRKWIAPFGQMAMSARVPDTSALALDTKPAGGGIDQEVVDILKQVGSERAAKLIAHILRMNEISMVGMRDADSVVERLIDAQGRRNLTLSSQQIAVAEELLAVSGQPSQALDAIERLGKELACDFSDIIPPFRARIALLDAAGLDHDCMRLQFGFRRSLDYYSSFIFELIHDFDVRPLSLAGGGRYDRLFGQLQRAKDIPAVGFAIGIERVLYALKAEEFGRLQIKQAPVDCTAALVQAGDDAAADKSVLLLVAAAQAMRHAGWRVQVEPRPKRPRKLLTDVLSQGVPFVAMIGDEETGQKAVTIRDLGSRTEERVPLEKIGEFVRARIKGSQDR